MTAPSYQWVCQRCKATNEAGLDSCTACGFSANYTVSQLNEATGAVREKESYKRFDAIGLCAVVAWCVAFYAFMPGWVKTWLDPRLLFFAIAAFFISLFGIVSAVRKSFREIPKKDV